MSTTVFSRFLYVLVFAGGWLFFTRGLAPKRPYALSVPALAAGLLLLLGLDRGGGFAMTCLRYAFFTALYGAWALLFLSVRPRYALWLAGFFTLLMGVSFSVVQVLFRMAGETDTMKLIAAAGLARAVALLLLGRLGVRPDGARDVSVRELLLGLFPALACFLANLFLFEIVSLVPAAAGRQGFPVYALTLFFGLAALVVLLNSETYFALRRLEEENERTRRQLEAQTRLFAAENESRERVRALRHDIANHLHAIERLAADAEGEAIRSYAEELRTAADAAESPARTGNAAADALLSAKAREMRERGVRLQNYLSLQGFSALSPMEICTLFSNALDNAAEAAASFPAEARVVRVSGGLTHGNLVVKVTNPCREDLAPRGGRFRSTKAADGKPHGYGIPNMEKIVRAHGGTISFGAKDGTFTLVFMIPSA